MKGLSPFLSGVMYVGIVISAVILVVNVLVPVIEKMKDEAAFEQALRTMNVLDKTIQEVLKEGKFSSRIITISVDRGKYIIDNESDRIEYVLETEAPIVSPGVKKKVGNIIITSGSDVDVIVVNDTIIMRNSYVEINFTKLGNESYFVPINLSTILEGVYLLKEHTYLNPNMTLKVSDIEVGNGYVAPEETGYDLPKGVVIAHLETKALMFDVYFTLTSYADFVKLEVKNMQVK